MVGSCRIRQALPKDIDQIVKIYNSNAGFLQHHLGKERIERSFVEQEMKAMACAEFCSCVVEDMESGACAGVLDYRPGDCVYLSLLMLDAEYQRKGYGKACYTFFEQEMLRQGAHAVRIDVVDTYVGNAAPFWRKCGFSATKRAKLEWGGWQSEAVVMVKRLAV